MNQFDSNLYGDTFCCTLHFDASLIDLDFDSRSQEDETAKLFAPVISQSF